MFYVCFLWFLFNFITYSALKFLPVYVSYLFNYQIGWVILYSIVLCVLCMCSLSCLSWPADGQQGKSLSVEFRAKLLQRPCFSCTICSFICTFDITHTHRHVCHQRSRGTRAAWAVGVTATWTSRPASASVSRASLDASARVPLNRAFF